MCILTLLSGLGAFIYFSQGVSPQNAALTNSQKALEQKVKQLEEASGKAESKLEVLERAAADPKTTVAMTDQLQQSAPAAALTAETGQLRVGPRGYTGAAGKAGAAGVQGPQGEQGVAGSNDCIDGVCVSRQLGAATTAEPGSINIAGSILAGSAAIGIANPASATKLHVSQDGLSVNSNLLTSDTLTFSAENYAIGLAGVVASASQGQRPVFKGVRSRGTLANPTAPNNGDFVLSFLGAIYDGATTQATAMVNFKVDGTVSTNVAPQSIGFFTSSTTAVARTERLTIRADGSVGIANTSAVNKLAVNMGTTADPLAQVIVATALSSNKGLVVQGVSGQSADLLQMQDSLGNVLTSFNAAGRLTFGADTNLYRAAADTLRTDDSLVVAGQASIGTTLNANRRLNVVGASNDPSAETSGTYSELTVSLTSANTQNVAAIRGLLTVNGNAGSSGQIGNLQTSTIYDATGVGGNVNGALITARQNSNGGGVTNLRGLYTRVDNNSAVTNVATARGLQVDAPQIAAGGVTAYNGIYVQTATSGVSASNYGLLINGTPSGATLNAALALSSTSGTAAGGILMGSDTNLYRSAADTLTTDDRLAVAQTLTVLGGSLAVTGTSTANAEISFSANIRGKNQAVTTGATSVAVSGKTYTDTSYGVLCTPSWNTTCWVSGSTTTGFTLNFGTAAPSGAVVNWLVIR